MKKTACLTRFICQLFVFSILLTSCSSVYEHMPETTGSEISVDHSEEYFTTGDVVSAAAANLGVGYEGQWIYIETGEYVKREDNPNTSAYDPWITSYERLVKYNPVTQTVSSLCLDPTCMHSSEECPFFAPQAWLVSYYAVFGDWLMYSFSNYFADSDEWDTVRNYLYNLKTGEMRKLQDHTKVGELLTQVTNKCVMNGKIYTSILQLDYTGKEEHKGPGKFIPKTQQYVEVYDPRTDTVERLCEISDDLRMICISNKRFFFVKDDYTYWSSDYNGENMNQENALSAYMLQLYGKYAYYIETSDYSCRGYHTRGYDLETDSIFYVDLGEEIRHLTIDSGKIVYTTFDQIAEFKIFANNTKEYVLKLYPNETDVNRIVMLENQIRNSFQYDGNFRLYVTDALGKNKELVFEGENMNIQPLRVVGDYLFGYVSYGDPNNNFAVTYPGNGGRCALNLEAGEITLIPQLKIYLDSQQ